MLLLAAPAHRLNAVTLNKALFYLDIAALRDQGETVTHNTYVALEHGPVVAKYQKRLIAALEERGIAKQLEEWDGSKPVTLVSARKPKLNADTVILALEIARYFSGMSSARASEFSHKNPGWAMAWEESLATGKTRPIDLRIAMQQIIEDDPWLAQPLSAEEQPHLESADLGEGEEW